MKLLFRGYLHLFISTFVGSALTETKGKDISKSDVTLNKLVCQPFP